VRQVTNLQFDAAASREVEIGDVGNAQEGA
jgi:hypothetical protein